ncbi:hypothetical protein RchiOBHm_Chr5g0047811 [Rosa chinensis]|uniref:Uncharacterized protein n=1 Tax=Rosa chinensis TaxID=74649 RepID=A0A2P6QEI8_ROSCH|nr:hypothetical protein RchiOBHm_Chr5g0047811 [Rosa chinensis]
MSHSTSPPSSLPSLPFHISSFLFFGVWFSLVFSQIAFFFCSSLVTSFNWWIVTAFLRIDSTFLLRYSFCPPCSQLCSSD